MGDWKIFAPSSELHSLSVNEYRFDDWWLIVKREWFWSEKKKFVFPFRSKMTNDNNILAAAIDTYRHYTVQPILADIDWAWSFARIAPRPSSNATGAIINGHSSPNSINCVVCFHGICRRKTNSSSIFSLISIERTSNTNAWFCSILKRRRKRCSSIVSKSKHRLLSSRWIEGSTSAFYLFWVSPTPTRQLPCPQNRHTFDNKIAIFQKSTIKSSDLSAIFQKSAINRDFSWKITNNHDFIDKNQQKSPISPISSRHVSPINCEILSRLNRRFSPKSLHR